MIVGRNPIYSLYCKHMYAILYVLEFSILFAEGMAMLRLKRMLIALLLVCLLIPFSSTIAYAANTDTNGDGYNDNDYDKILAFLKQPSAVAGKINGLVVSEEFDQTKPSTWLSLVQWDTSSPKRVYYIGWSDLHDGKIAGTLDLRGCTALHELDITGNQISSLNVGGDTALQILSCSHNSLLSLDVSTNTALKSLYCSYAHLSALDVSGNTALENLGADHNALTQLSVGSNTALLSLHVSNNAITSLDLSANTALVSLSCGENPLVLIKAAVKDAGGTVQLTANGNGYVTLFCEQASGHEAYYAQAIAKDGYQFKNWTASGNAVSDGAKYDLTIGNSYTLVANFPVTVHFDPQNGSAASTKTIDYNALLEEPAVPVYAGNVFGGWYKEPACIHAWNFSSDRAALNTTLYARWGSNQNVIVQTNNAKYGTVKGGGTYGLGLLATVTAVPQSGCYFVKWMEGNTVVSYDALYTFTVGGNRTLKAYFTSIGKPSISVSALGYSTIKVSWKAVPGAKGYQVLRSLSSRSGFQQVAKVEGALSFTDTIPESGRTYYYQVKAYSLAGDTVTYSKSSSTKSVKPKWQQIKPKAKAQSHHSVLVSWNAVAQADGYEVRWDTRSKGAFASFVTDISGTSYAVQGLQAGSTYYFKVRPYDNVDGVKVYGPLSSAASAKPLWPLVTLKASLQGYHSAVLTWNAIAAADGYELYRSTSSKSGFVLIGAEIAGTSFSDELQEADRTYYYKVRPYDVVNGVKLYGSYSGVKSIKPKWPAVKISKAVSQGYYSALLNWNALIGVSGYEVWRSTSSKSGFVKVAADVASNSYLDSGLSLAKYYYKVRAYATSGETRMYGAFSAVKSVIITEDFWYKEGMYKVGADIPAGEYYFKQDGSGASGYWEIDSDNSGDYSSIISNEVFWTTFIATVRDGEYLEVSCAKFTLASNISAQTTATTGFLRVGKDIPAGQYRLSSTVEYGGYVCVFSSTLHIRMDNIVTIANFLGDRYVTVKDGQYLYLEGCVVHR